MVQAGFSRERWAGGVGDLEPELGLQQRQALAVRDPQLPLHQVQPRHSLSDWVLDLQATHSQPQVAARPCKCKAEAGPHEGQGLTVVHVYLPLALSQPTHSLRDSAAAPARCTFPRHSARVACCGGRLSLEHRDAKSTC